MAEAAAAEEAALFDAPPPEPEDADPVQPEVKSRGLDESVVAVLREEAEREAAARRAEASQPIETQTEMGLTATMTATAAAAASPAAQRIAMMKGVVPDPPERRTQTRREMLPAIEEINSTLRATSERRTGEPSSVPDGLPAARPSVNSFRNGFVLMMLIATIGVFAYVMAPRIGQQIPGLAPTMAGYVETVDSARIWLDGVMKQAISALRGFSEDGAA